MTDEPRPSRADTRDAPALSSPGSPAVHPAVHPGRALSGRYRLGHLIASGGMAQVWEATDDVLARKVAVKLLHPHLAADESVLARFRREAVAAARLAHPAIVSIYDTCSDNGAEAIVMELVRGTTLRQKLDSRESKVLEPAEAVATAAQAADALEAAHRSGVVHRDVKPANILLSNDGRVLVADFGIARALDADTDLTQTGITVGTVKYLAPEQVEGGPIDARTDVYALGVVLYEMLCGRPPFQAGSDAATALARLHHEPLRPRQVRASVPRDLEAVILKAMARRPDDRYSSAAELRGALLAARREVEGAGPDLDATIASGLADMASAEPMPMSVPSHDVHDPTPPGGTPKFTQTERGWLVPTLVIVLIATAIAVAGVLFSRTEVARDLFGSTPPKEGRSTTPSPAVISAVRSFDPQGDGQEKESRTRLVIDGLPATSWETDRYNSRAFGGLKKGLGLVLTLDHAAALQSLEVDSPTAGWAAQVYVSDQPASSLAAWGTPVATQSAISGEATFELRDARGRYVLLWITDLGSSAKTEISDVRVLE